jgi:hypothetical protein
MTKLKNLWRVPAAAVMLILALGGCWHAPRVLLPVGTCVVDDEKGMRPVACGEAHTHKVIAIAPRPEDCPGETSVYSSPADPDEGTITECFRGDNATR